MGSWCARTGMWPGPPLPGTTTPTGSATRCRPGLARRADTSQARDIWSEPGGHAQRVRRGTALPAAARPAAGADHRRAAGGRSTPALAYRKLPFHRPLGDLTLDDLL